MSIISWAKYRCDVCGAEQEADLNPHHDKRFDGWVRYRVDRIYNSAVRDASTGVCDGDGELCPKCFAATRIQLKPN